jgi:hypothetical protein
VDEPTIVASRDLYEVFTTSDITPFSKAVPVSGTAKHFDDDKPTIHRLPLSALTLAARVNAFGAKKYGEENWRGGMGWMRLLGSCARHLYAFIDGEDNDKESGLSHIGHLLFDAMMLADYLTTHRELDDRYKGGK